MNRITKIEKKYDSRQVQKMISFLLIGVAFVLSLSVPLRADNVSVKQIEIAIENIEKTIDEVDDSEEKIKTIDGSIEYLQNLSKEVSIMKEDTWRVANTFSGVEPVVLQTVRDTIDIARTIEKTAGRMSSYTFLLPKPQRMPTKAVLKAVEMFSGLFAFFCEGMTKSLENLATGMHSANVQSITLAGLKEPLYPGLRKQECREVYEQIIQAESYHKELGKVSSLLSSEINKLKKLKDSVQDVEEQYFLWIKQVASTVDSQIIAAKYNESAFSSLKKTFDEKLNSSKEALGSSIVAVYRSEMDDIITIAKREAKEGAEVMAFMNDAGKKIDEAQKILNGCEKYGIDVDIQKGGFDRDKEKYEEELDALKISTSDLIKKDGYLPRVLEEALEKRALHKAQWAAKDIEERCDAIKKLLDIPAQLSRITPNKELISLPAELPPEYEIPLKVKVSNVLNEPLVGAKVEFDSNGDVEVNPSVTNTDASGIASVSIVVQEEIQRYPAGSSVTVEVYNYEKTTRLNYVFAKPGVPVSIVTVSQPKAEGVPGTQLPDQWVVQVKDKDGYTINNTPLTIRFEALNGGGVSPDTISNPVGRSDFATHLTLGLEDGKGYKFQAKLFDSSGLNFYNFYEEITIQGKADSSYGSGAREIVTHIGFNVNSKFLAIDTITADVTKYPLKTSYVAPIQGAEVIRMKHEHYKTVTVVEDGEEKEKQVLDFTHPYDVSTTKAIKEQTPRIVAEPSKVVSIKTSEKLIKPKRVGKTEIKATINGITGYKPTHPECDKTIVETGIIKSGSVDISVVGIKEVDYTCSDKGDHFYRLDVNQNPALNIGVGSSITVSDGSWEDYINSHPSTSYLHVDIKTEGDLNFTRDSNNPKSGMLKGTGLARMSAYLKDSDGKNIIKKAYALQP